MKYLFSKYDSVCVLEDDILCSADFLDYHYYVQERFDLEKFKVFTTTGYAKRPVTTGTDVKELVGALNLRTWYSPDGVVFTRPVWDRVLPHITNAYFNNPRGYLDQFRAVCRKMQPRFEKATWLKDRHNSVLQAGLLNTLRASWGMYSLIPEVSRCQDIGVYGTNHPQKVNKGEDVSNETFWKEGGWYSRCFKESNDWGDLYIHRTEDRLSGKSIDVKGE
jgi:hypothetical protein